MLTSQTLKRKISRIKRFLFDMSVPADRNIALKEFQKQLSECKDTDVKIGKM